MPLCGAKFDENSVPPWTRGGLQGGLNAGSNPPRRSATAGASRHPSEGGDFQRSSHIAGARCDVDKKNVGCVALFRRTLPIRKKNLPGLWCVQEASAPYEFSLWNQRSCMVIFLGARTPLGTRCDVGKKLWL